MKIRFYLLSVLLSCLLIPVYVDAQEFTGDVRGKVIDSETKSPLFGASVSVAGIKLGCVTDSSGNFEIRNVPVGNRSLKVNYVGYSPVVKTDVIVNSRRSTMIVIELTESDIRSGEVVITPAYFEKRSDAPTSMTAFSFEEIRRAPGSGGDISRIVLGLPSLAKVNDQSNSLIVRGGSPMENEFQVDGIEVPNINHFPTQGATGGPIGIINVDLIRDVSFAAGGFPATYGDKLSSVMEISLRDGSRTERNTLLNIDFAGFGGVTEGPIAGDKASYVFSVRRSYLDALIKVVDVGSSIAPSYGDAQLKVSWDISPVHSLKFVDVFSDDHNNPDRDVATENKMEYYGNQDIYVNTAGAVWLALWSDRAYTTTSLSYSGSKYQEDFFETNSGSRLERNHSYESTARIFTSTHLKLNDMHSLEFGAESKIYLNSYDNYYDEYTDALGDSANALTMNSKLSTIFAGGFLNYIFKPASSLTLTAGLRGDYFRYNSSFEVSPRLSASYDLTNLTTLKASAGVYYQNLPIVLLSQNEADKNLKTPRALQYVAGIDQMLSENTKLTMEMYLKNYSSFPVDPTQPGLFLVDELFYRYGFYTAHGQLSDNGAAKSYGIEVTLQKKLAKDFYGLASASYFRSRYKGDDGIWRDRAFDNRFIFSVEGGYRPGDEWEFSARWIFAGGVPYTPLDQQASANLGRDVLDGSSINGARYPDYQCLNLRVDKRFFFSGSNLVAYVSVWNAYNRKNVAQYFWNAGENKVDVVYQWGLLPIFGVEYEF